MIIKKADKAQLAEVFALYERSFPPDEVEPVWQLEKLIESGKTHAYRASEDGRFAGFALVFVFENIALISFLAVDEGLRGTGAGSKLIEFVKNTYADKTVTVEIESPTQKADNTAQRVRRKTFYDKNGFESAGFSSILYGTQLDVLCADGTPITPEQYMRLQKQMLCDKSFANIRLK